MPEAASQPQVTNVQVIRETVESLAVAFVLALLFKAFVAEAFVIPTGSMAPTLMGAHKDVQCEECGYQYQCGASSEYTDVGAKSGGEVFGTTCPLCRKPQVANPNENSNLATFSGDRILVSKLAYMLSEPRRWDVIVFKFIEDARLNYIKRCIGRPNETVRIAGGDIYIRDNIADASASTANAKQAAMGFEIARKPPHVMNAMLQPLYDSNFVPKNLVKAGLPSAWQPFPAKESPWQISQTETAWSASITGAPLGSTQWMRFYHRVIDPLAWESVQSTGTLPAPISMESSRLITDFTAYNTSYLSRSPIDRANFRNAAETKMVSRNRDGFSEQMLLENDGFHWTGDLAVEVDVQLDEASQMLVLMLIEAGVEHEC